jgi:hypothetical protein
MALVQSLSRAALISDCGNSDVQDARWVLSGIQSERQADAHYNRDFPNCILGSTLATIFQPALSGNQSELTRRGVVVRKCT